MSCANLTISPVVKSVTVSPVQPALTISGVSSIPSGAAGGDLAGSYPNPTVDGLRGRTVAATAPTAGQVLVWNDSLQQWEPGAASAGVSDGDKGDITVSGSGATWTIDNDAVTLAKIQDIASARLLGNASGVSASPSEVSVTSPLAFNTGTGTLGWTAPGNDGRVYYRSGGSLTNSAFFTWDNATSTLAISTNLGDIVSLNPTSMTIGNPFSIDSGANTLYIGDTGGAGNGTLVTIDDVANLISFSSPVTGTTADFDSVTLENAEFLRNTVNGRVDIMPAPSGSSAYGIYFDLTSWTFGVAIGTVRSSDGALDAGPIRFNTTLGLNNATDLSVGASSWYTVSYRETGGQAALTIGLLLGTQNAGSSGALVLVQNNERGNANRIPSTDHADPTLYVYARGSASASDYVRVNHDTTNGTIESGDGKLIAKAATRVRIEGSAGGFDLPTGDGSSGQVLTTNGSGDVSWATPSGGGVSEAFVIAMAVAL